MDERIKLTLFVPETCTVGQLLDILFWPKNYDELIETEVNGARGAEVKVSVKPEYLDELKEVLVKGGGLILFG